MKRFFILLSLLIISPLFAEESSIVKATADISECTVGDPIKYTLVVTSQQKDVEIELPSEKVVYPPEPEKKGKEDEKPKVPLYVISDIATEDNSDSSMLYKRIVISISYFRVGSYKLPEVKFRQKGMLLGYRIPDIKVNQVNKSGEFADVEPPLSLRGNYYRVIWIALASALAAFALFFLVKYLIKRWKRIREEMKTPAIDLFYRDIELIQKGNYLSKDDYESYAFELSTAFRKFAGRTLSFDALEMTNPEIIAYARKRYPKYSPYIESCERIFNLWDMMKFAEFSPDREILERNMKDTIRLAEDIWREVENAGNGV